MLLEADMMVKLHNSSFNCLEALKHVSFMRRAPFLEAPFFSALHTHCRRKGPGPAVYWTSHLYRIESRNITMP